VWPVPALLPGDIVGIDNLALHKSPEIRKAIEAEGAGRRFLPRYSPGFNPIDPSGRLSNISLREF
jgi:transposase